jgi:23S rRNA pseudouridine1911/1915/1917 synthase
LSPETEEILIIDRSHLSERLDSWLRSRLPQLSRGAIQRLITEGHITVDGRRVKPTHAPRAGERVAVRQVEARQAEALPEDIPLEVLFEDDRLLVINKPAGLVVHPGAGHNSSTLVNALLHHCRGQLSGIGGVARPGIVHRLDKDTSGCMVVAKTNDAHNALSVQFASRKVTKIYEAIVCGVIEQEGGDIRAAISRNSSHRKRMAVNDASGRDAHTSYKVLERFEGVTLVEAQLHTGRTHQVRVHFKHIGHPLVGDSVYGNRQNQRLEDRLNYRAPRQMLHARRLGFFHPSTGRAMSFDAPRPDDFVDALSTLRGL